MELPSRERQGATAWLRAGQRKEQGRPNSPSTKQGKRSTGWNPWRLLWERLSVNKTSQRCKWSHSRSDVQSWRQKFYTRAVNRGDGARSQCLMLTAGCLSRLSPLISQDFSLTARENWYTLFVSDYLTNSRKCMPSPTKKHQQWRVL